LKFPETFPKTLALVVIVIPVTPKGNIKMSRRITRRTLRKMILQEMKQIIREEDTVTITITVPEVPEVVKEYLAFQIELAKRGAAPVLWMKDIDWNEALTTMRDQNRVMFDSVMDAMESAADAGEEAFRNYLSAVGQALKSTKGFVQDLPPAAKLSMGLPGLLIDFL